MPEAVKYIRGLRGNTIGVANLTGVPVMTTGSTFYVDSVTGSDNDSGKTPAQAKATIDAAIGLCTANKGDVIYILPGHAETVTATSIAYDVAGVRIIGLGQGLSRPTFTFGAAAATITVSAANSSWENCVFIANFADVAAAFTLAAAKDFKLVNNDFLDTTSSLNFFNIIVTGSTNNAADGLTAVGNYGLLLSATGKAFISVLGNLDRLLVTDNHYNTQSTADAAQFITMSSKVCLGARILRNTLIALGATGTSVGIFITGSSTTSTGIVADNRVTSLDTTSELLLTATLDFACFENYYTGVIDKSGYLVPAADSAA